MTDTKCHPELVSGSHQKYIIIFEMNIDSK
jgi:hypothetical protein